VAASIIRWTKQLKVIVDIIYSSNIHLTADEVYVEAQKVYPNISLGTVYRNLNKLKTHAIISEVPMGTVLTFTKHPDTNAHFECDSCHRIYCISLDLESKELSKTTGFNVSQWSLMMHGVCNECENKHI
jgi:Fur family transcriptional regulator, peroxide stress response regulator